MLLVVVNRFLAEAKIATMPVSPARAAAYEILLQVERASSFASELLHSSKYVSLSKRDHGLANELVLGTLRWRSRLDEELEEASSQSISRLDIEVLVALRLGLYQLRCLDRIPKRAAVFESAELVKLARKHSAASFVNAVLRKLSNRNVSYGLAISEQNLSAELIARALAHPPWLVERWAREYGVPATQKICTYDQSVPPTAIRLRTPSAENELRQAGVNLTSSPLLSSARIVQSGDVTSTRAFREGHLIIQDQASQLIAALIAKTEMKPESRRRILDCCAAPGGKTIAIADRFPIADVTAVELHPHRARLLQKLLHTGRVHENIAVIAGNAERLPLSSKFDCVLADVPCSGTGTLARNPEIKWRLRQEDLKNLQGRQSSILQSALTHVETNGRLIYSTCSLEREENETVVEQALSQNNFFHVVDCSTELASLTVSGELAWPDVASLARGPYLRTIPGIHPCEGFFAAILEKI